MPPQKNLMPIRQYSWKNKLFGTALISGFSFFWYMLMMGIYWETVSLQCKPKERQSVCSIRGEYPGGTRALEISKAQLSGVKAIRQGRKQSPRQVVLSTLDKEKIPLTRCWSCDASIQVEKQMDQIAAFIADPQAQTLRIETRRNFPLLPLAMTGGIIWFNVLCLKRLWIGLRSQY
jgi:hypothetical protein